jgi:sugar lactone lactonase YvrE
VIALDTKSGTPGPKLPTNQEPLASNIRIDGATYKEIVPPGVLQAPSGLELHNNILYVSDNKTGRITAFSKEGKVLNHIDTGFAEGSLMGMTFGSDGKIYLVDSTMNRVVRFDPKKK